MPRQPDARDPEAHLVRLGRLASMLSHEIRNPLETIMLQVTVMEEELQQPDAATYSRMAESLADVKTALSRIDDLIQDYLSLTRLIELHREPVDLGAVIEAFAGEMCQRCADRGITLHLEGVTVIGQAVVHRNSFRRVLVNLVHNAMDAMPQGGVLTLRGTRHASQVCVEVQDTGNGIPEDRLSLVFEPFWTTKPEGTGLGLYVAQQILAAHGGAISLTSTPGSGTTCRLTLPVVDSAQSPLSPAERPAGEGLSAGAHSAESLHPRYTPRPEGEGSGV